LVINGYYINDYWWIFYWWILVVIIVAIDGYFINGYWCLFYCSVTEQWVTTQCELFLLFEFNFCNRQLFWLRITLHYYKESMTAISRGSWRLITREWGSAELWWGVELQLWVEAVGNAWWLRRFREKKSKASKGVQIIFGKACCGCKTSVDYARRSQRCVARRWYLLIDKVFGLVTDFSAAPVAQSNGCVRSQKGTSRANNRMIFST